MSGMELLLQAAERSGAWDRDPVRGGDASPPPPVPALAAAPPSRPPFARSGSHGSQASLPLKKRMKLSRHDCGLSVVSAGSTSAFDVVSSGTFGRGRTESPTVNSDWGADDSLGKFVDDLPVFVPGKFGRAEQPAGKFVKISPEQWRNILQTVTSIAAEPGGVSGKADAGKDKTKASKSRSGRSRKRKATPLVRDVDGNDVGMGYFSAIPARNAVSPVAEEPAAVPASPPPLNLQDSDTEESSVGAESAVSSPAEPEKAECEDDAAAAAKEMLRKAYLSALRQTERGQ